jgi:hypothetical protein
MRIWAFQGGNSTHYCLLWRHSVQFSTLICQYHLIYWRVGHKVVFFNLRSMNIPLFYINKFSLDHSACPVILYTSLKTAGNIANDSLLHRYRFHCTCCVTMFAVTYRLTCQAVLCFNYKPAVVNILPQFLCMTSSRLWTTESNTFTVSSFHWIFQSVTNYSRQFLPRVT